MKTMSTKQMLEKLGSFLSTRYIAPNLCYVSFENGNICISYDTIVAALIYGETYCFTKYHDYSNTTNKHLISYCGMNAKNRRNAIYESKAYFIEDYKK